MGIFWQSANACTIVLPPLRKQFRDSAHIFVFEVTDISDVPKNYKDKKNRLVGGIVRFKVEEKWKGAKQPEISLYSDIIDSACGNGSPIDYFRKGEKYLIFAEKDYVYFYTASKLTNSENKIKRLNDFWFRFWSRVYPF